MNETNDTFESAVDMGIEWIYTRLNDKEDRIDGTIEKTFDKKKGKVDIKGVINGRKFLIRIRLLEIGSVTSNFHIECNVEDEVKYMTYRINDDGYLIWTDAIQKSIEILSLM